MSDFFMEKWYNQFSNDSLAKLVRSHNGNPGVYVNVGNRKVSVPLMTVDDDGHTIMLSVRDGLFRFLKNIQLITILKNVIVKVNQVLQLMIVIRLSDLIRLFKISIKIMMVFTSLYFII